MKHIEIIPDCPVCRKEMTICTRGNAPYDEGHPYGTSFTAWYRCFRCGHTTEPATKDSRYEAISHVQETYGYKKYSE